MPVEDPIRLLGRLRLGREEFCQRLLTMLILNDGYPPWNTRREPSSRGAAFLRNLDTLSFGDGQQPDGFVDEFDLPARHDLERGCAPDYAVLWNERLWMIELKTEVGSHRSTQIPAYLDLGRHHYPGRQVDLTYLTPPMRLANPAVPPGSRIKHLTWADVTPLITDTWRGAADPQRAVVDVLLAALAGIGSDWKAWRAQQLGSPDDRTADTPSRPDDDPVTAAVHLADATSRDGKQRALDWRADSLEALQDLRLAARNRLDAGPTTHNPNQVHPWLWNQNTSGGRPLTAAGQETGYELRLSRYRSPST